MKYFIKKHQEQILIGLSIVFMAFITLYFVLSMRVLLESGRKATSIDTSRFEPNGFNVGEAKELDYRGAQRP